MEIHPGAGGTEAWIGRPCCCSIQMYREPRLQTGNIEESMVKRRGLTQTLRVSALMPMAG